MPTRSNALSPGSNPGSGTSEPSHRRGFLRSGACAPQFAPQFDPSLEVRGRRRGGLCELRPRAGRSRWRPIYRRVKPSTFVILAVAPEAQIDSRGFAAAVTRAAERFAQLDLD